MPSAMAATPVRSIEKVSLAPERAGTSSVSPIRRSRPDAHVLEEELAGGRRVQAHLAQRLRLREAGHAALEDEAQDLALAGSVLPSSSLQMNTMVSA